MEKIINCIGMACPLPVVNAKNACEELHSGDILTILVDNEIAVQNLQRFAQHKDFPVSSEKRGEKDYAVTFQITGSSKPNQSADDQEECLCCDTENLKKGMLVILSSNTMGSGDERLGTALMKAFVFALTKQDQLPESILCYNSGAYLTCEGADTLEDLKLLESQGVTVLTCGTCLDFYGLKEKLAVGSVTNMYDIVERMELARTVVKP